MSKMHYTHTHVKNALYSHTTYFSFGYCVSLLHPHDSQATTLDVLAGIRQQETCETSRGARIRLAMQEHSTIPGRYVNVMILENHLSNDHLAASTVQLGEIHFQHQNNNTKSYLRIATRIHDNEVRPPPLITFGSTLESLRLHEATADISEMEKEILLMTTYMYDIMDQVEIQLVNIVTDIMKQSTLLSAGPGHCNVNQCLPYPVGEDNTSQDSPDSLVMQVSIDKPYTPHYDGGELKACNHCNDSFIHHDKRMPIATTCYVQPVNKGTDTPDGIVSIRHSSLKNDDGSFNFLKYIGFFSSQEHAFIQVCEKDMISMGGSHHLHLQMRGCQDGLLHHITPVVKKSKSNEGEAFIRAVVSPRLTRPFHLTKARQLKCYGKYPPIHPYTLHVIDNVPQLMRGESTGIIPLSYTTNRSQMVSKVYQTKKRKNKPKLWKRNAYANGEILDSEKFCRNGIVGGGPSYKKKYAATSIYIGRQLYDSNTSIRITFDKSRNDYGWNGPLVLETDDNNYRMIVPGETFEPKKIDSLFGISSTDHKDAVISTSNPQVIHLRRAAKNDSSILKLELTLWEGTGQLNNIVIRGSGAALRKADAHAIPTTKKDVHKYSATHYLPTWQRENALTTILHDGIRFKTTINIFSCDMYCGAWTVKKSTYESLSLEENLKEVDKYNQYLQELQKFNSNGQYPQKCDDVWLSEIASRLGSCYAFELEPLDRNILHRPNNENWRVMHLGLEDFVTPTVELPRDLLQLSIGLREDAIFTDVSSIIKFGAPYMKCLTDNVREEHFQDLVEKENEGHRNEEDGLLKVGRDNLVNENKQFHPDLIINAALHGSGHTLVKAGGNSIIKNKQCDRIIPPRFVAQQLEKRLELSYPDVLKKFNLKPLMGKAIHPATLAFESANCFAMEATSSHNIRLRERKNDKWVYRNGESYILADETGNEAWCIVFKCIICTIISPTALLQIQEKRDEDTNISQNERFSVENLIPSPGTEALNQFIRIIEEHEWNHHLPHYNFRKVIKSETSMSEFIRVTSDKGMKIFQNAVRFSRGNRSNVVSMIEMSLNQVLGNRLNTFLIQLMMRTIESCIHEPFGRVEKVPGGYGSICGARHFLTHFSSTTDQVPKMLLTYINKRAHDALLGIEGSQISKEQCKKELHIIGLEWSEELNCLIHTSGIGKQLDSSDTEHMLCMFYVMYKNTQPSANSGKNLASRMIDGEKHFPVCFETGGKLAKDLPVMNNFLLRYSERICSYIDLMADEKYKFRFLESIFEIDHKD